MTQVPQLVIPGQSKLQKPALQDSIPNHLVESQNQFHPLVRVLCGDRSSEQNSVAKPTKFPPSLWMLAPPFDRLPTGNDADHGSLSRQVTEWHQIALKGKARRKIESLFESVDAQVSLPSDGETVGTMSEAHVLLGIAACHLIPRFTGLIDTTSVEGVTNALWTTASIAEAASSVDRLLLKTLGIELGITLCHVCETPNELDDRFLIQEFEALVEAHLDGDGCPHGNWLNQFGMLVASWTRTTHLLRDLQIELDFELELQLDWMVRQCLRMSHSDRQLAFATDWPTKEAAMTFWRSLLAVSGEEDDAALARVALQMGQSAGPRKSKTSYLEAGEIEDPFNLSEWGSTAVLRSTWSPKSPRAIINFSSPTNCPSCAIEIGRSRRLISGNIMPEWIINDRPMDWEGEFEVVCDRFDEDLDYLELQLHNDKARFNRQFLLSRTDEFLMVADSMVLNQEADIHYQCDWPFAANVSGMLETETREIYLTVKKDVRKTTNGNDAPQSTADSLPGKIQALALPLSLPEWKTQPFAGKLECSPEKLTLWQSAQGRGMYVPIVFDLNPQRSRQKRTWRQLTLAQERQLVAADDGVAFRFQLDRAQWFFYRAVSTMGNRTFLGENTNAEFVFNSMDRDGTVTQLIEIQP